MSDSGTKASGDFGGAGGASKSRDAKLSELPGALRTLRLEIATLNAHLHTIIKKVKERNTRLATLMTQLHFLKSRAEDIKRQMKPAHLKKVKHLIDFQEISMEVATDLLRQAME